MSPSDIFKDKANIDKEYKDLARKYHPDLNKDKDAVEKFQIINNLYTKAKEGCWDNPYSEKIITSENKTVTINYLRKFSFELGYGFICNGTVIYVIGKDYGKYYTNMISSLKDIKFRDSQMKDSLDKLIPKINREFLTKDGDFFVSMSKTKDVLSLRDVLNYYNGSIPHKHTTWIISRLYNLVCFFSYNKISHNGLTIDNLFISPEFHSVVPMGGWWFSKEIGEKLIGLPKELFNILPPTTKLSESTIDLEAIRYIGRLLFKNEPSAIDKWKLGVSEENAILEYEGWSKVIKEGYGKRKFIPMNLVSEMIYKNRR